MTAKFYSSVLTILKLGYVKLFIFLPFIIFSQKKNKAEYIVFSGKIENVEVQTSGKRKIRLGNPYILRGLPKLDIIVNEDGSFQDTIKTGSGIYYLDDGKNGYFIYFSTSANSKIIYDSDKFKNNGFVVLQGSDTIINRYFIEKSQNRIYPDRDYTQPEENYKKLLSDKKRDELFRLEKSKVPDSIYQYQAKNIQYDYLSELFYFVYVKSKYDSTFTASKSSLEELSVDYSNEKEYKVQPYYSKLVATYYDEKLDQYFIKKKAIDSTYSISDLNQDILFFYDSIIPNKYIKNDIISQSVTYYLKNSKNKEKFYNDFKNYYTGDDNVLKEKVYSNYLRYEKLKAGTASPEFNNYLNVTGERNSLKDFRGKFVYIDIWATWCGNCYDEFPLINKLVEEYKNKNITFVSLSLDKYENRWINGIKEQKLLGVQLLANPKDKFFEDYAIQGIPRYILLDPEGKIIDYNAPRPSQTEELRALFKSVGL